MILSWDCMHQHTIYYGIIHSLTHSHTHTHVLTNSAVYMTLDPAEPGVDMPDGGKDSDDDPSNTVTATTTHSPVCDSVEV